MNTTAYRPPLIVQHTNTKATSSKLRQLHGGDTIVANCPPGTETTERLSLAVLRAAGKTDSAYRRSINCELLLTANLAHRPDIDRIILTRAERLPSDVINQIADIASIAGKQLVFCFAAKQQSGSDAAALSANLAKLVDRYDAEHTAISKLGKPPRQPVKPRQQARELPYAPRVHPIQFLDASHALNTAEHHAELASGLVGHLKRLRSTQSPNKPGVEVKSFRNCLAELVDGAGSLDELLIVVAAAWIAGIHTGIYVDFNYVSVIAGYESTATNAVAEANDWWAPIETYLSPEQGAAVVLALAGLDYFQMEKLTLGDVRPADGRWRETRFSQSDLHPTGQRYVAIQKYYRQLEGAGDTSGLFHTNRYDKASGHLRLRRLVRDPKNDFGIPTDRPLRSSSSDTLSKRYGIKTKALYSAKIDEPQPQIAATQVNS